MNLSIKTTVVEYKVVIEDLTKYQAAAISQAIDDAVAEKLAAMSIGPKFVSDFEFNEEVL